MSWSAGNDLLAGGDGADRYVFTGAFGDDQISRFQPSVDAIEIDVPLDLLTIVDSPDGAVITTPAGHSILVLGIPVSRLRNLRQIVP